MMERVSLRPRNNWPQTVESQGLHYHTVTSDQDTPPGRQDVDEPYWDESACYHFRADEIDALEACTYALNDCCLRAAEHILANNLFQRVGIPDTHVDWVRRSWERDEHTIYGRFDLCYAGAGPPRLLEYN